MAGAGYSQEYIPNLANYKGLAIVIGMDYSTTLNHEFLPGTEMDVRKMSETFSFLKFAVIKLWNIGKDELISKLSFITQYNIECRRIAVVFSGHGKLGQLYLQDGKTIKTEDLFRQFRYDSTGNVSLAKVQLFFIDACRGDAVDHGIYTGKGGDIKKQRIPTVGDVLIAYSTTAHHKAFEHRESGGLWLNLLARELEQSDKAITEILVDVNYQLKSECQRSGIPFQTAECINYLTENVHLRREALESSSVLGVTQMSECIIFIECVMSLYFMQIMGNIVITFTNLSIASLHCQSHRHYLPIYHHCRISGKMPVHTLMVCLTMLL